MVAEIGESIEAGKRQGISFDSNFTDKVSQSEAYKVALNSGNSLAQTAEANFSKAREASHMASESYQKLNLIEKWQLKLMVMALPLPKITQMHWYKTTPN